MLSYYKKWFMQTSNLINYFINQEKINGMLVALNYLKSHKKASYLVCLMICLQFIVAVSSNELNALITDYYGLSFSV